MRVPLRQADARKRKRAVEENGNECVTALTTNWDQRYMSRVGCQRRAALTTVYKDVGTYSAHFSAFSMGQDASDRTFQTNTYSSQKTGTDGRSRQMIVSHSFSKPFSTTTSSIVFALLLAWYVNAVCPSACRLTYPGPLSTPLAYAAMLFMPRRRVTI